MAAPFRRASPARRGALRVLATCLASAWLGADVLAGGGDGPDPAVAVAVAARSRADDAPRRPGEAEPVRYGRDVRPLLSDRCFACHGADEAARQADLRLDEADSATAERGGSRAIVPGDIEASELWARITSDDPRWRMPPPEAKKAPLTAEDRRTIAAWIEAGAEYEPHWSFVAPERPPLPEVVDERWAQHPVDRFVRARMERQGVTPSPPASPATRLRRLFLDVTGLPPTLDELDAFEADPSDAAWDGWVRRLLHDEPYRTRTAEHLATPWLDAARYADTIGIHTDNGRQMWLWRDWVLEAFRGHKPYDAFVTEQLAGDLLPDATVEQRVATGFLRSHVITDEGGAIDEEYLVEYAVDRLSTTSAAMLGLTMGCARCHDHKYDPITQEDFYSLYAFFNSNDEPGLYSQDQNDPNRAFEPSLEVPPPDQQLVFDALQQRIAGLAEQLEQPLPGEDEQRDAWIAAARARAGVDWHGTTFVSAVSSDPGVTLTLQDDGAVLAGGVLPMAEDWTLRLTTDAVDQRLLLLECLSDPGEGAPGAGRAFHGNAVLSDLVLRARPLGGDGEWSSVPFAWGWADHRQPNGDYEPLRAFDDDPRSGWTPDGNERRGPRTLVLMTDAPFGTAGGTELQLELAFRSPYTAHSLSRVRVRTSALGDPGVLPVAHGRWYRTGALGGADSRATYDDGHGPEHLTTFDTGATFEEGATLSFDASLQDGVPVRLDTGVGATYLARVLHVPSDRTLPVSLGSDDGFQLWLDGVMVAEDRSDRGVAPDQNEARLELSAGEHVLVMKVVNTGGPGGYFYDARELPDVVAPTFVTALLPDDAVPAGQAERFALAWRRAEFDEWRALDDQRAAAEQQLADARASVPRTMVMKELPEPRPAFVLNRGAYDQPDEQRPVTRRAPGFLPPLPEGAPADRRGFAAWLVSDDQPLFSRVAVNRIWEGLFGEGLVRTSEDFGLQGEWPTHPELLDWLAVEFRESGWSVTHLLTLMLTSRTYSQSSALRPELAELDPDNRLLHRYPRRRLSAEQIRDLALYASGLLVEQLGGPSVKPYQPAGLWREVAMTQSNTRTFVRGDGDELWRRSLYTYWKRAVPPPAMQTFDAPTRESCVVSRRSTNTPLQALVLWNDEQFVEAARALAARTLAAQGDDEQRITALMRRCTGRAPDGQELSWLTSSLARARADYGLDPEAAAALLGVGEAMLPDDQPAAELAAWTWLANAVLSLHETVTQD